MGGACESLTCYWTGCYAVFGLYMFSDLLADPPPNGVGVCRLLSGRNLGKLRVPSDKRIPLEVHL